MRSCSCHGQSLWRMLCLLPWRALLSKNDLSNSATSPGVCLANPARRKKDTQGTKFSPCVSFHCFFSFIFLFWWVGVEGGCKVSSAARHIFFVFYWTAYITSAQKNYILPPSTISKMSFLFDWRTHNSFKYSLLLCVMCFCDFREAKKNFLADPCDFPESSTLLILSLTLQLDESYRCLALDPRVLALQAIDATDPLITSGTS